MTRSRLVALAIAAVAGLFAAWSVDARERAVVAREGQRVAVVVTTRPVRLGGSFDHAVTVLRIPERWAPRSRIASLNEVSGARAAVRLDAGVFLSPGDLTPARSASALRPGERAVTVAASVSPVAGGLSAGAVVDVYVSGLGGGERTDLTLSEAEVLGVSSRAPRTGRERVTLRVATSQVAGLLRADTFSREIRLVVVPSASR